MRHADRLRRPRRLRPATACRGRRDRSLLVGLGLVFALLTLAWFDVDTATPATPPTAGAVPR